MDGIFGTLDLADLSTGQGLLDTREAVVLAIRMYGQTPADLLQACGCPSCVRDHGDPEEVPHDADTPQGVVCPGCGQVHWRTQNDDD